ncbi:hypothetical protein Tco_0383418 [Tanacetum coccineum]
MFNKPLMRFGIRTTPVNCKLVKKVSDRSFIRSNDSVYDFILADYHDEEEIEHVEMDNVIDASLNRLPTRANLNLRGVNMAPESFTFPSFTIKNIAQGNVCSKRSFRISKVIHGDFLTAVWPIWNQRNKIVHAQPDDVRKIKDEHFSSYPKTLDDMEFCSNGFLACQLK